MAAPVQWTREMDRQILDGRFKDSAGFKTLAARLGLHEDTVRKRFHVLTDNRHLGTKTPRPEEFTVYPQWLQYPSLTFKRGVVWC